MFVDLSNRVKLNVGGNDAARYLNGQITADIKKATSANATEACLLDAKGRMAGQIFLFATSSGFMLDADPEQEETLPERLERYIIADDVTVENVTDRLSILHVVTDSPPALPKAKWLISAHRFLKRGWDIWIDASQRDQVFAEISATFPFCDASCAEALRIEEGIPRWGRELTNAIIPIEANLEECCIDYEKGCYVGQEVISRMKMSGQRNKKLCGLVSMDDLPLIVGMQLIEPSPEARLVGSITSVSRSQRLSKEIGLGFVKRGFNAPGSVLEAHKAPPEERLSPARVQVVDLPFGQ